MSDRKPLGDQNDTPDDVATLYSWANLHGAKYRDFSASRAETRESARQQVQEAIDRERQRASETSEAEMAEEAQHTAEAERAAEAAREAELAAQQVAHLAAQEAEHRAAQESAQHRVWQHPQPEHFSAPSAPTPAPSATPCDPPQQAPIHPANPSVHPSQPQGYSNLPQGPAPQQPQAFRSAPVQPSVQPSTQPPVQPPAPRQYEPLHEESVAQTRIHRPSPDPRETPARPAWLMPERIEAPVPPPPTVHPEETLQGSRDRLASRWFALRGVFAGESAPVEAAPAPVASRAPVMAIFSLAGGVGKTSLVATLGRALSARGERVLLVDTAAYGLLPFFFGARDQRPGLLRTFSPPGVSSDAPIQMVTIDPESLGPETNGVEPANQNTLSAEISRYARGGVSRVIVDLATASGATTRRVMRMAPMILVPVVPDMNSVVSVTAIDEFFEHNSAGGNKAPLYYVLNQFDPSLPLHLDIREVLRQQLGDRLLPFALRRTPVVSEALAEGMTVMDYAPNSTVAEDFGALAGWVKNLSAPASTIYRGVRWSER